MAQVLIADRGNPGQTGKALAELAPAFTASTIPGKLSARRTLRGEGSDERCNYANAGIGVFAVEPASASQYGSSQQTLCVVR